MTDPHFHGGCKHGNEAGGCTYCADEREMQRMAPPVPGEWDCRTCATCECACVTTTHVVKFLPATRFRGHAMDHGPGFKFVPDGKGGGKVQAQSRTTKMWITVAWKRPHVA